jgi:hypothetical protein
MSNPRFVIGAGIAAFGFVLMLDRLHIVDADYVLRLWPLVIVAVGIQRFFNPRPGRSTTQGVILIAFGGWLLLNTTGALRTPVWEMIWPLVLIWFGSRLMQRGDSPWPGRTPRRRSRGPYGRGSADWNTAAPADAAAAPPPEAAQAIPDEHVTIFAIMSGVKRTSASPDFRGGDLTAFMGGGQLDLRQATIPPGGEAALDILAFMGGFEIVVPPGWVILTPLVPIMGGVEDKRLAPPPGTSEVAGKAAPRLSLHGFVMMGGVSIKN